MVMSKLFYSAFEEKYRGTRENIKNRVNIYLPFILPLKKIYPDGAGLDIGCGRGEWLELLKENGITAQGIDLDENMLKDCSEYNLDVLKGDGFAHLKTLKDDSLTIISAFHIVEHIPFEILDTFVSEALRVLKPAGLLIIETPNPENIKIATEHFYLDPTHTKPIPSKLLSFLVDFNGFERTKILRVQEEDNYMENHKNITLSDVIHGVSPDYSVIAQKKADDELLKQFEGIFSQDFGLPLGILTSKFEDRFQILEAKASQAEAKANQIIKPLKWFMSQLRLIKQHGLFSRIKALAKKLAFHFLNRSPKIKLKSHHEIVTEHPQPSKHLTRKNSLTKYLTPRSNNIYMQIKIATRKSKDIK